MESIEVTPSPTAIQANSQEPHHSKLSSSRVGWMAASGVLAGVAVLFAVLPWLEVSPSIQAGLAMLSGLLSAFGDGSYSLPSIAPAYSVPQFIDLAQALDQVNVWLKAFEAGTEYFSQAQEASKAVGAIVIVLYAIVAIWAIALVTSTVGLVRYFVTHARKKAVAIVGLSLLLALSGAWTIGYNLLFVAAEGADSVVAGHALNAVLCMIFCIGSVVSLGISSRFAGVSEKSKMVESASPGILPEAAPLDLASDSKGREDVKFNPIRKGSRAVVTVALVGGAIVAVAIALGMAMLLGPSFNQGAPIAQSESQLNSGERAGQASGVDDSSTAQESAEGIAASIDGAELSEQTVSDYISDFRKTADLQDDDLWTEWLEENGYTAESVRDEVIEFYIGEYLLNLACEENSVTITEEELQSELANTRSLFESEEAYEDALAESNITEDSYVETVLEPNLRIEKLMEAVEGEKYATEEELNEAYQSWMETYRASKQIAISDMPLGLPYDV
ncbi:SurA N-terminal domain-containing protein [uncultured Adlercreutzia sp.]|uniref:SurA N-terminal domain-containing protein n=1 Tax=uncultured Adlercreutzia sp. TaxID=875803 RepID=UPI0026018907|nr:SurA N-terminal domain-containing protein [uncultured Adlercreutzia sp.]